MVTTPNGGAETVNEGVEERGDTDDGIADGDGTDTSIGDGGVGIGDTGGSDRNRKRGVLFTLPFLAVGVADILLIIGWGVNPLWGFAIFPPILFCSVIAYLAFSTDFLDDRT